MKAGLLILGLVLLPAASFAAPAKIFFFGGAQAQGNQMKACYPKYVNISWAEGQSSISKVVGEINKPENVNKEYVIAGHSSGAKWANMVALRAKNPKRIKLRDLDGFAPDNPGRVPQAVDRVCWRATNGKGLNSRNFKSMNTGRNCGSVKTHTAPHCKTQWCLHFSMINPNVPANLHDKSWVAQGYKGCKMNSAWAK